MLGNAVVQRLILFQTNFSWINFPSLKKGLLIYPNPTPIKGPIPFSTICKINFRKFFTSIERENNILLADEVGSEISFSKIKEIKSPWNFPYLLIEISCSFSGKFLGYFRPTHFECSRNFIFLQLHSIRLSVCQRQNLQLILSMRWKTVIPWGIEIQRPPDIIARVYLSFDITYYLDLKVLLNG